MKLRGEFHRADGLVIPNNITTYGAQQILQWGLTAAGYNLHMALANCNPNPELLIESLGEPTIGTFGYARQPITQDATGWPTSGTFNGESYMESEVFMFEAVAGDFDAAINRLALVNSLAATSGQLVVALSNPLTDEIIITPATAAELRSFKYRIYAR